MSSLRTEGCPLQVLLISAVRGVDPLSGDVTYTEQLVSAPPPMVRYTTYVEALRNGSLEEVGSRAAVRAAAPSDLPLQLGVALWRKTESVVRRSGIVYREPLRHFRVKPGSFDLVHVHVFHNCFIGAHPPVVMSAGGPLRWLYANAWGWSRPRLAVADAFDRVVGSAWGAAMCGTSLGGVDRLIAFSKDFHTWLIARGWSTDSLALARNYLKMPQIEPRPLRKPSRLGFIAKDFKAKGGDIALRAFEVLRERHPELTLLVVGSPPPSTPSELRSMGVTWVSFVERDNLILQILPKIDILMYPSRVDTSVPYGPMESLATGIPCVVSDYGALPELVGERAGRVSRLGDVPSVVAAVEELLEPSVWKSSSDAARARFEEHFSAATQSAVLGNVYRETLELSARMRQQ